MDSSSAEVKILVADDSPIYRKLVEQSLSQEHYIVLLAKSGRQAMDLFLEHQPALVITDWSMPDISGIELCQRIRRDYQQCYTYVILLTGNTDKAEVIEGLAAGADDYLTKPFSPRELVLRIQNLLRRLRTVESASVLTVDEFRLDKNNFEISVSGKRLELTTTEFKLLVALLERRGRTLSRQTLLQDVWGYENIIDTRTVDTHIRRLREKLGEAADRIVTIRGEGYRFLANRAP